MVLRSRENNFGAWAFLIGVVLALIVGIFTTLIPIPSLSNYTAEIYALLIILGLLVGGFTNVSGKEGIIFLVATATLVVVSKFGMDSVNGSLAGIGLGTVVSTAFAALLALFVPATIIIALKTVFSFAKV